jgi:ribonuclease PH
VASVTGGFVALSLALDRLRRDQLLAGDPVRWPVAAVSVGLVDGQPLLDLPYEEDNRAEVDMNLVMTGAGELIEVQGTAEGTPFDRGRLDQLLDLGWLGVQRLCELQREVLQQAASAPGGDR